MSQVAVVTDSTAYLPEGVADKHEIAVVPLHVALGPVCGLEGVEVLPAEVARALGERRLKVTTSRPTTDQLVAAYRGCGTAQVVSVHLSSTLSGTYDAAVVAAEQVAADGIEVRVVDSRSLAMGLGFRVIAAAEAASGGASLDGVEAAAHQADATQVFYVDTLEHLRRGGRMTAASALLGTALGVKPLLVLRDGSIEVVDKVRTFSKAMGRLRELVREAAGEDVVDVAVHHLAAPARAAVLADELRAELPGLQSLYLSEVGAVVGAHVGPGMLGVVVWRR